MGLLEKIEEAGVVGCGGAGFPTHIKLKGSFEYLIVNGAECEPLLRNDRYLMRHMAREIVEGTAAMAAQLNIPRAVIALKSHYRREVQALREAVAEQNAPVSLFELESFYPAGDEQTLVFEVTGRVVPPGGLPGQVGVVVNNVATVYAVYQALQGKALTEKYITVTGEVNRPAILRVPVGTSLLQCLELAGGARIGSYVLVVGGPMMGKTVPRAEAERAVVTKTTSGILVLPEDGLHGRMAETEVGRMLRQARSACIQCSYCTQLCPRNLLGHPLEPHRIMRKMAVTGDVRAALEDPVIRSAQLCCECGICEVYACPMGLQPRRINALIKGELASAGIRYERQKEVRPVSEHRQVRKAPTERVAARAGVHRYYAYEIDELICGEPEQVRIPLKMHIGVPAAAQVSAGERVRAGDLIALPPPGKLGARIHASISGRIDAVGDSITIVKE